MEFSLFACAEADLVEGVVDQSTYDGIVTLNASELAFAGGGLLAVAFV